MSYNSDTKSCNGLKINEGEGKTFPILGNVLFFLYKRSRRSSRKLIIKTLIRLEEGRYLSTTLRRILSSYHKVEVGYYTSVLPALMNAFPPGTHIGRFSSLHRTTAIFGASHPTNTLSSHAAFYNPELGYVKNDFIPRSAPYIGNDVFTGYHSVILNNVKSIGDGAYIAAGTTVTKDVPPYAVVAGNPGRIIKYRFSEDTIAKLLQERWWDNPISELLKDLDRFRVPLEGEHVR